MATDAITRTKRDIVIANRILAQQNVLDAYGHVSMRHPHDPNKYFLSRSLSPALVEETDIIEYHLDGRLPMATSARPTSNASFMAASTRSGRT